MRVRLLRAPCGDENVVRHLLPEGDGVHVRADAAREQALVERPSRDVDDRDAALGRPRGELCAATV